MVRISICADLPLSKKLGEFVQGLVHASVKGKPTEWAHVVCITYVGWLVGSDLGKIRCIHPIRS